ncbi:hypothetical protein [Nocardioides lianchengensis]|uniref:Uncharacterized protein n=1 Tax=Nocardioides lianchengensis TaxID=1045774 RepID=A0A1G6JAX9_9ACTN|nr:hypothetical protein [Nocardioides lianchengensis]NYG12795.1 chromosome segregation ATPase [Nocardioides lianchengensis]SDC16052.1 hypothetical protein SAMN05421872_101431 [Nocardioides lianchengensis]
MHVSTRVAGVVAGVTLTLGSLGTLTTAPATAVQKAPCAQQQKQVDKATAALARVTAVFERQQDKVAKARHEVRAADTARERRAARAELREAKEDRGDARAAKKAQQQRLAKAEARLDRCEAQQPVPTS